MGKKLAANLIREEHMALMVEGSLLAAFGLATILWPGITIGVLTYLVAGLLVVYGLVGAVQGLRALKRKKGVSLLIEGLIEIAIGAVFLWRSEFALETLILFLGLLFVARGAFGLVRARTRHTGRTRSVRFGVSLASLVVGVALLIYPIGSIFALVWLLGLYALFEGVVLLFTASDVAKLVPKTKNSR